MNKKRRPALALSLILISFLFIACTGGTEGVSSEATEPFSQQSTAVPDASVPMETDEPKKERSWDPKEPVITGFDEAAAQTEGAVSLDLSGTAAGYAGVRAYGEKKLKFQVVCGDRKYNYDLPGDGTPLIVPLQMGSGDYSFRVLENTTERKYVEIYSAEAAVALADEFVPFLRSSSVVRFAADSQSVEKARALAAEADSDAAFAEAVYGYLKTAIAYDYALADSDPLMYYPDPDATLKSGKGICLDYAATAAAMLRSMGIPTKMITGYVTSGDIYHAWNMIYLKDKGWVAVQISAGEGPWQRIDITFASTGASVESGEYKDKDVY